MGSQFDAEFLANAVPDLQTWFGESATYTPAGGSARSITISVMGRKTAEDFEEDQRRSEIELLTWCKNDAVSGIDAPQRHDKLVYDGVTWRFSHVVSFDQAGVSIAWTASQDITTRSN